MKKNNKHPMRHHPTPIVDAKSTAKLIEEIIGQDEIERIARETGFIVRQRDIVAHILILTLLSCLGCKATQWIAELHRTYNRLTPKFIEYKPFHNQLRKTACPIFIKTLIEYALQKLILEELMAIPGSNLELFDDILLHDGSTVTLNARLSKEYPGRFKKTAPAAAELHVTLSVFQGQPQKIHCAPDKDSEKHYRPDPAAVRRKCLIADRGYQDRDYFMAITDAYGYFLVRGTKNIKPIVLSAENAAGQRIAHLENKELCVKKFPRSSLNLIIQWNQASGHETYIGRLVVLYRPGPRNKKEFQLLHTNLPSTFTIDDIQKLYRLRWQIELIFKEWKSYSNLHGFATGIKEIAESLIWASILTAIVKRTLVHCAELKLNMYLSSERAASTAMNYFLDIISAILLTSMKQLVATIEQMFKFFSINAKRAHPKRDRKSGRLQVNLCLTGKISNNRGERK